MVMLDCLMAIGVVVVEMVVGKVCLFGVTVGLIIMFLLLMML